MSNKKTNKLNYGSSFDNDDDLFGDNRIDPGDQEADYLQAYVALGLEKKIESIETACKSLVSHMTSLFVDTTLLDTDEKQAYVKGLASLEATNLASLVAQVEFGRHALTTLMRQLEAGGHINVDIYSEIIRMQDNTMKITLAVSQYIRTMPAAFKNFARDVGAYRDQIESASAQSRMLSVSGEDTSEYGIAKKPIRGTRELFLSLRAVVQESDDALDLAEKEIANSPKASMFTRNDDGQVIVLEQQLASIDTSTDALSEDAEIDES